MNAVDREELIGPVVERSIRVPRRQCAADADRCQL
jgi:hypothetical protein